MEQEIKDIISKNLPAHVGDVLKKRLEEADADKNEKEKLKASLLEKIKEVDRLGELIKVYQKNDDRNAALSIREAAVETAERNFKIATLEAQLAAEKDKTEFAKAVGLGLVRNIDYRKTVFGSQNLPETTSYAGGGSNTHYMNKPFDSNETKSAE